MTRRYAFGVELFLVRHAIALPGEPDESRPLSDEGTERFRQTVAGLERLSVSFERVYHSPLLRAVQTTQLLHPLIKPAAASGESSSGDARDRTVVTDLLARAPSGELLRLIASAGAERLALVGHQPCLSELIAWLVAGHARFGGALPLKKGGVAHLTGDEAAPGRMRLEALLTPRVLRRVRG